MKVRRYSVKGFMSFDVEEDEEPEKVLAEIEQAFDNDIGSAIGHGAYFGPDDGEGPFLEDEFELEDMTTKRSSDG